MTPPDAQATQRPAPGKEAGGDPAGPGSSAVGRRKGAALAIIAVAQLLIVLDGTIVSIALPSAQVALHISEASRSWVVTIYALTFGGLLLLGGRIADYVGRRRALVVGLLGFAAASVLGAVAPNAATLFSGRALQGAFAAVLSPSALSLLAVTFPEGKERARAFAVFGAVAAAGGAVGLLLGGVLTEFLSWRWCLGVGTPIAVATAVAARAIFSETSKDRRSGVDIGGAVTATLGLAALVFALSRANTSGWSAPITIALFGTSAALLAAFAVTETRSAAPLLPPRVILDRNRGGAFLVQILLGAALLAVFVFLTFYFQQTLQWSPLRSGFSFLPVAFGIAAGAVSYAALSSRVRPGVQIPIGLLIAAGGLTLFTRIGTTSNYWADVLPPLFLIAFGVGLTSGPVSSIALVGVAESDAGVASAMVDTTQQVGGAIGTALLNTIFAGAVSGYLARADNGVADGTQGRTAALATIHGYHVVFLSGAGLLVTGALLSVILITVTRQQLAAAAPLPTG